jgi:Flp pilus assembly protein TadG
VEFAVTIPVFLVIFFGAVEFSRVNLIRNTADIAATEGARAGVVPGAIASDCQARAEAELRAVGVKDFAVTVFPDTILGTTPEIDVTVTVPLSAGNGYFFTGILGGREINRTIRLQREPTQGS